MSVADKLLQLNQVKQNIKTAIETKGIPMTNVAFTKYANKILDISGGGGEVDEYFYYSKAYYTITNNSTLFLNAWQDMLAADTVLYDLNLQKVASNYEMEGIYLDIYVGDINTLYSDLLNKTYWTGNETILINGEMLKYYGDIKDELGLPIPIFNLGGFDDKRENGFLIADLTPLQMGIELAIAKWPGFDGSRIEIKKGFEYENENGVIIPESVTSIGSFAFSDWTSNNQPLVIPESVTSIGDSAFYYWTSNNQPLTIPNSVTNIGEYAFHNWTANNQPLVIPNSVTDIGYDAFAYWEANNQPLVIPNSVTSIGYGVFKSWLANNQPLVIPNSVTSIGEQAFLSWQLVPYVEMKGTTPPTLANSNAFSNQNNAPIYVPDASVTAYKTATQWVNLASRIFSINDK